MKLSSVKVNQKSSIDLQITPMIDVVFLLLIFFMVNLSVNKTEKELDPAIKQSQAGGASQMDFEPVIVEIVLGANGRYVYRLGASEYGAAELKLKLDQFPNKFDGAFVKVSDGAPFGMAATAIQHCKSTGFNKVSYVPGNGKG